VVDGAGAAGHHGTPRTDVGRIPSMSLLHMGDG
jgi:hypothetical protein